MRQMLTDHARARRTEKRGGAWARVSLSEIRDGEGREEVDLLAMDEALTKLARLNERQSRIVELRFLTGLPVQEGRIALEHLRSHRGQ